MRPTSSLWRLINLTDLWCRLTAGDASARSGVDAATGAVPRAVPSSEYDCATASDTEGRMPVSPDRLHASSQNGEQPCGQ
jgi:hypothetical protein